jgi:hypothetical protein
LATNARSAMNSACLATTAIRAAYAHGSGSRWASAEAVGTTETSSPSASVCGLGSPRGTVERHPQKIDARATTSVKLGEPLKGRLHRRAWPRVGSRREGKGWLQTGPNGAAPYWFSRHQVVGLTDKPSARFRSTSRRPAAGPAGHGGLPRPAGWTATCPACIPRVRERTSVRSRAPNDQDGAC